MGIENGRKGGENQIKSIHTMFKIVDQLRDLERANLSELVQHLEMPKSTVHIYLQTLKQEGYVIKQNNEYRLSLRFLEVGGEIRQQLPIFQVVQSQVANLSSETGEVANFAIEEGGQRVLLYTSTTTDGLFDNSPTGQYTNMHWTALGKALLSQLPDTRIHEIVDLHGLPEATTNTITNREELFNDIEQIRERNFSVEDEERRTGIKALAVPINHNDEHTPVMAISISGPKQRIEEKNHKDILNTIQNAGNVIELQLKHY